MKKRKWTTVLFVALLSLGAFGVGYPRQVAAAGEVTVRVNGTEIQSEAPARVESGWTMVPLRACAEALLAQVVNYDTTTKEIAIQQNHRLLSFQVGSSRGILDGEFFTMDMPAKVENGRTLVPLRVISEAFGASVAWDQETKTVDISLLGASLGEITGIETVEQELLTLVNQGRAAEGLVPLLWADPLCQMARIHTTDMITNEFFGHQSLSRGNVAARAGAAGVPPTAENLAAGYDSAAIIYNLWLESPTERANIMDPLARFMGAGVSQDQNGKLVATAEFLAQPVFMVMDRSSVKGAVANPGKAGGYAVTDRVIGTLYQISAYDSSCYTSAVAVSSEVSGHTFQLDLGYLTPGLYALQLGTDVVYFRQS